MTRPRTFTVRIPIDVSGLYEARRHDSVKVAAAEGERIVQSHVIDLSNKEPLAVFELSHRPKQLQILAASFDTADDDLLRSAGVRMAVAESDLQGLDVTLAPLDVTAVLIWIGRRLRCRHELSLRNIGTDAAYAIRVTAATAATKIVAAFAPATWTQLNAFPHSVTWQPSDGSAIPPGDPLPGTFAVFVGQSSTPGKWVRVEWLGEERRLLCEQLLRVECGRTAPDAKEQQPERVIKGCRCLSAEASDDEDSNEASEPDLSVEVGTALESAFQQVTVPYTIEIEPPSLAFTQKWDVTFTDELGDEQPIVVPTNDDLNGNATFTLPGPGDYNFYLTVTDPEGCVSESNRDEEESSDIDFTSFRLESAATTIGIKDNVDPCDPRKYEFTDTTEPIGTNPQWTITDASGTETVAVPDSNGVLHYTFPQLNETYSVCLTTDGRPKTCVEVTPVPKSTEPGFEITYSSCGTSNFVVTFENTTTTANCPVQWDWDFGDGTPHSTQKDPVHTYAAAGVYNVTLTVTISGNPSLATTYQKAINIYHWEPDIVADVCPDGHVIYSTSAPCNWSWKLFHCQRTWQFPGGHFNRFLHQHKRKVRVCYDSPGGYDAFLTARNEDGGECTKRTQVKIDPIARLCPHDKEKDDIQFSYGGKDYRMRTVFKYHGAPGRILAKTKLQVWKNNRWRRKRAYEIGVRFSGTVYTKGANGCYGGVSHPVGASNKWTRSNRAKVKNWRLPLVGFFRVKQGDLTSDHMVRVDANHQGVTHSISLWTHDCHCS